jgi:hypothetical protein
MVVGSRWQRVTSWVCTKEVIFTEPDEYQYLGGAIVILNSYDILAAASHFDYTGVLAGYSITRQDTGTVSLPP